MKSSRIAAWALGILLVGPLAYRTVNLFTSHEKPVDPAMAQAGKELFLHEWTPHDPLANGGDGLGPVFNANSCVACHRQGGVGGSGPLETNVNVFTIRPAAMAAAPRQGVVHTQAVAPEFQENFSQVNASLPSNYPPLANQSALPKEGVRGLNFPKGVNISQRKTPALFGARLIDEIPVRDIIANERVQRLRWGLAPAEALHAPVGRALRMADGRVGRFGWKGQTVSLVQFVRAACANELGLGNPGQAQPQPLGSPGYQSAGFDLTLEQCDQLAEFIGSLPRPVERTPQGVEACRNVQAGRQLFSRIGCADCHVPNVGHVDGIYSDLLLHRMGQDLEGGGDYNDRPLEEPAFAPGTGPHPSEWRTPPLWGVARSAPYLHDGRAATLAGAIRLHGGQGAKSAGKFANLSVAEQDQLVAFLKTLDTP